MSNYPAAAEKIFKCAQVICGQKDNLKRSARLRSLDSMAKRRSVAGS